jgi:hypothetical protein
VPRLRPSSRVLTLAFALAFALATVGVQGLVRPAAAAQFCGAFDTVDVNGKQYVVQNNVWGASTPQCIEATTTSNAFSVTSSGHNNTGGTPASYPSVFRGCHWGNCTNGGGLPLRVDNIGSATSSWSVVTPNSGAWNVAYDLWFNSTANSSPTQAPDHAELMIWLNSRGGVSPAGSIIASNVSIAGATWNVWTTQFPEWRYIAYQRTSATNSVSNLDIRAFVNDSRNRGLVQPTSFLIGAEAGFEIWQGGAGLVSNAFTFNAIGGTPPPTTTTIPPPTTSPTTTTTTTTRPPVGGCQVTYRVQSQWNNGFVADVTVRNNGAAVNGWTLTWAFAGNQQIGNTWNAVPTQTGQNVSARDGGWNASLPTNGTANFGFQAAFSGTNTNPSQFRLNGTLCTTA